MAKQRGMFAQRGGEPDVGAEQKGAPTVRMGSASGERPARRLKVLALTPYPRTGPSSRVRVYQFAPGLAAHGIDVDVRPFLSELAYFDRFGRHRRITLEVAVSTLRSGMERLRGAPGYDVVLVSKYLSPVLARGLTRAFLTRCRIPIILDVDDHVFYRKDTRALARSAHVVVVGNKYLGSLALKAGAPRTHYIPSVVEVGPSRYSEPDLVRPTPSRISVGWIGTGATYEAYLASHLSALAEGCREVSATMTVVGPRSIAADVVAKGAAYEAWSLADERRILCHMDIGLMPLTQDAMSKGKCAYKAVQYGAHGIPCISSRVGAAINVIDEGVTGFLVSDVRSMVSCIQRLVRDEGLRRRMGMAARSRVLAEFSYERGLAEWVAVIRSVTGRGD